MPIGRIRGSTPTEYNVITDNSTNAELMAQLDALNTSFRAQRAQRLEEYGRKMLDDYQPPPNIRTPDREPSTTGLPSPSSSPPPSLHQLPTAHPTPPSTGSPQPNRLALPSAEQPGLTRAGMRVPQQHYRRITPPSAMTTGSRTTPHTPFLELSSATGCARSTMFRVVAPRKPTGRAQDASTTLNRPKQVTKPRASGAVKKRLKAGTSRGRENIGTRAIRGLARQDIG
ncbi:MAG: hypothetical protein Q9184_008002 [Pyrenodesmia sp. 2 TL-2023]